MGGLCAAVAALAGCFRIVKLEDLHRCLELESDKVPVPASRVAANRAKQNRGFDSLGLVEETNNAASPNWARPSDAHTDTATAQVNGDSSAGRDAQAPHIQPQLDVYGDVRAWICTAIDVHEVFVAHMALVMLVNTPSPGEVRR